MTFNHSAPVAVLILALFSMQTAESAKNRSSPYSTNVSLGFTQFEYPERFDSPLTFDTATIQLAGYWDNAYLSADVGRDTSPADISQPRQTGRAGWEGVDIALGYRLGARLWLVIGDKHYKTEFDYTARDDMERTHTEFYEQEGLYYGFAYNYPLKRNGVLKFNLTYADLETDNDFGNAAPAADDDIAFNELTGRRGGTAEGYSYGVSWIMPLSETLFYQAGYQVSRHEQRVDTADLLDQGYTVDNTTDESLRRFTMGLQFLY